MIFLIFWLVALLTYELMVRIVMKKMESKAPRSSIVPAQDAALSDVDSL